MKKILKRSLIGILAVSTFFTIAIIGTQQASAGSYSCYLEYGDYYAVFSSSSMTTDDSIYWSFSSTNNVWLDVWILDDYNYGIYDSGGTASGYHVSDFQGTYDSGTFEIPYTDKWYVIFVHGDSYEIFTTTHVTITINFIGIGGDFNLGLILGIVIPVVVVIIVGAVVGSVIAKKKRQPQVQQAGVYQQPLGAVYHQPMQVVEQPPPVQSTGGVFCKNCGGFNPAENRFCVNCGGDLTQ